LEQFLFIVSLVSAAVAGSAQEAKSASTLIVGLDEGFCALHRPEDDERVLDQTLLAIRVLLHVQVELGLLHDLFALHLDLDLD